MIGGGLVPFPGSQVQRVIPGKADVSAFLSWREAICLDWACLAVPLAGQVLINAVPIVKPAPVQDFALRTHQMMARYSKPRLETMLDSCKGWMGM